jgi:hypothetical protein
MYHQQHQPSSRPSQQPPYADPQQQQQQQPSTAHTHERPIVFYSQFCRYSNDVLQLLTRKNLRSRFVMVCVDTNRQQVPAFVTCVPLILTPGPSARQILVDAAVERYIASFDGPASEPVAADFVTAGNSGFEFVDDAAGAKQQQDGLFGFLPIDGLRADEDFPRIFDGEPPPDDSVRRGAASSGGDGRSGGGGGGGGDMQTLQYQPFHPQHPPPPPSGLSPHHVGSGMATNVPSGMGMGGSIPPPMLTTSSSGGGAHNTGDDDVALQSLQSSRDQLLGTWWQKQRDATGTDPTARGPPPATVTTGSGL